MTSEEPRPDRCAAKCRDGGYCTQYPVNGRERCKMHGGKQPQGMDSPNAVHGLRSDYLSEEDQEIYDEVRQHSNVENLQEEFWMVKTKLLRAAKASNGSDGTELVRDLIDKIDEDQAVSDREIKAFAKLLQTSSGAVDQAIGRLIDLSKQIHKETEGETVNLEHGGRIDGERTLGDEEQAAIREALSGISDDQE